MKFLCAACAIAILSGTLARADDWARPQTTTYQSSDTTYRLTIVPSSENAPDKHGRRVCEGTLDKREGDAYRQIWRRPLANSDAPVQALVAKRTGYVVTFDNWGQMGYGDNVVVIYSPSGELVRKLALKDFLSAEEIEALPHTVSSIVWGGEHRFNYGQDHVRLAIAAKTAWWKPSRTISIRLSDGAVVAD